MEKKQKAIYVLIALGIIISMYLTVAKYSSNILACPDTGVINCESVITSQYSDIFGIPTSVLGTVLFLLGIYMLQKRQHDTYEFLWSIAGIGAMLYSFTAQALLGEICIWCLSLDAVILATILVVYLWKPKTHAVQTTQV